jgi:hypothetical protein
MGLIEGPVGALRCASAQRPGVLLVTTSKSTRPAGPHYPWMETGIIDYRAYRVIHATDGRTERRNDRCPPMIGIGGHLAAPPLPRSHLDGS